MLAAVTRGESSMELLDVPEPGEPRPGEVVLRPEVVGVCGSDVHIFHGDLGEDVFPRIQGHEISAVIDALGPGTEHLRVGERVSVWPVLACGKCYPCSIGRQNVCANIAIIGAHVDGALQERLMVPASQVFAVGGMAPAVTAFVEPTSIGPRAVISLTCGRQFESFAGSAKNSNTWFVGRSMTILRCALSMLWLLGVGTSP